MATEQEVRRVGDAEQALVNEARAGLHPSGFDPSRVVDPVERAEVWQLHFYKMLEAERRRRRHLEDALDVLLPVVREFVEAIPHYAGGRPRFPGSVVNLPPECSSSPVLTTSCNGPMNGAPDSPTIGHLRMLGDAYAIAIEARSGETGTGSTEGESAGPQDIAQSKSGPSHD